MALADERLRPKGIRLYVMLGNDDPAELRAILDEAPWGDARRGARRPAGRGPRADLVGLLQPDPVPQPSRADGG